MTLGQNRDPKSKEEKARTGQVVDVVPNPARRQVLHQDVAGAVERRIYRLRCDDEVLVRENRRGRNQVDASANVLRPKELAALHLLENRFWAETRDGLDIGSMT